MKELVGRALFAQMWLAAAAATCIALAGCAVQRAMVATDAKDKMVGLTKEQVLACMGPPATKMAEGATEVWSYNSGNGRVDTFASGSSQTSAVATGGPGFATGSASTSAFGSGISTRRFCTVNVTMANGRVSRINYAGPTGGLLSEGEQCAFVVRNCVQ
jgi:hypothetical protein